MATTSRQIIDRLADEGKMFSFEYSSDDVDVLAPVVILFKTGAKRVKYRTDMGVLGSTVEVALYSGPTFSGDGTEITPANYNPTANASSPLLKIYHTPTKSANGTLRYTRYFLGYSQGAASVGSSKSGGLWRWLDKNTNYLAIITPKADDTQISYGGDFYEVD